MGEISKHGNGDSPVPESAPASGDRFEKIASNYGELFTEVFAEQGLDYGKIEESVFDAVKKLVPNLKEIPILDIGVGDGKTSEPFLKAGCERVVGIDTNPEMIKAATAKFGDAIKLILMDARDMSFKPGEFPVIVSANAVHNISRQERIKFWQQMLRLSPDIFVSADKIVDPNPEKHKENFNREVTAIKKVFGQKHNLPDAEKVWLDHYDYDERERLELDEIESAIGKEYDIEVVFEMGMNKTIVAKKKET